MRIPMTLAWICACLGPVTSGGAAGYAVTDIVSAAKRGDTHAVHRLLTDDPSVAAATDGSSYTALHWASIRAHWRIVAELVAAGAPVNAVGADGGTPLHWACHHDRADMVALLLDAGADVTVQNRWGRTPLHVAARRGHPQVAALLIAHGADPNVTTREGWTPLHVARMSDHPDLVELLIAAGADPAATDVDGRTPADVARTRPAAAAVDPEVLDDYVGIYDLGGGFTVKIWRDGDALRFREFAPDGLYPIGTDSFFCTAEPWRVDFSRGATGSIDRITLHFLRRAVEGVRTPSPQYVGSAACATCHSEIAQGNPHFVWLQSRHGHAYWRLAADWALVLGRLRPQYADLTDPIADDRCLLCHVTGRQDDNALFAATYREAEGVGCEACHGPGSLYMDAEVMADRNAFLAAGGHIPDQSTCRGCHRRSESFDWDEMWPKIAHGSERTE
ncbi:MAG: ankyrin repeat domain-containing protein [Holophagae bacterium]|jgi:hypothetical protein